MRTYQVRERGAVDESLFAQVILDVASPLSATNHGREQLRCCAAATVATRAAVVRTLTGCCTAVVLLGTCETGPKRLTAAALAAFPLDVLSAQRNLSEARSVLRGVAIMPRPWRRSPLQTRTAVCRLNRWVRSPCAEDQRRQSVKILLCCALALRTVATANSLKTRFHRLIRSPRQVSFRAIWACEGVFRRTPSPTISRGRQSLIERFANERRAAHYRDLACDVAHCNPDPIIALDLKAVMIVEPGLLNPIAIGLT